MIEDIRYLISEYLETDGRDNSPSCCLIHFVPSRNFKKFFCVMREPAVYTSTLQTFYYYECNGRCYEEIVTKEELKSYWTEQIKKSSENKNVKLTRKLKLALINLDAYKA